ncbi:heavy-metal-associated domain-containing protein [Pseudomonas mangrovi]|jgi:copper chaperone|uniref:Copper resistance protein CopZ n=1 Tax=Pseudomonas mangrovi TaxID=2161748 RepID=A0A2T5PF65_9PSED|nr:heavy-metal-associated domain-containing protein [Pseudomonas mangrovi]PTU76380.1 copper resistance protein CopZ [Pseudomonas mangrovi]
MMKFKVQGMNCGHCVAAVTRALQTLDPSAQVQVDLANGEVRTQGLFSEEQAAQAIRAEGYEVAVA